MLAILALAGCGGSQQADRPESPVVVRGSGVTFQAPAGWEVRGGGGKPAAKHGSELVEVSQFALLKAYRPALFGRVATELRTRMQQVAAESDGKVTAHSTAVVAGIRSHVYTVAVGDHVDEYTFVLRGRREYQLLCRRESSGGDEACRLLVKSFATT